MGQDFRFAARLLAKDRRFTLAAVLGLALAISVNSSVFALINTALLSLVALAASIVPARRAARVDPLTALRAE